MHNFPITIKPFGAYAVIIEWPNRVEEPILDNILQSMDAFQKGGFLAPNWEMIPAYNSLTLIHCQAISSFKEIRNTLITLYNIKETRLLRQKFLWRLPVCYDLDFGIDLPMVSEQLGLDVNQIIELHTTNVYIIYGIGFLPGFMYLGGLPDALILPRRAAPRPKVQKGAVGLAGKQTGIYPQESPGGWHIIGNCSVSMFNAAAENPCFVCVGDKVQFYQISRAEYDLHKIESEVGIYKLEKIKIDA
ncbi:5-oxoprolinase subunit PxpB [Arenibacter sp. GZD96]|uniref:5-oxoprolinase subunit PxpB n=1 Tax=Aurantibrevibacter litoralis TaxID=3106030 RepID=UPI002AFE72CC|nr:5-oxoprolinase subunit PxpB [Arenibacter sp. GZD-96]MEA1787462.1 5-oxoprolinase subunit PxpB [Arenibacter sp. GZD-96]